MLTDRTRVRRHADRGSHDRATIHAILDEAYVCHVGFVADGSPVVIPTAFVREDDAIYLHGAVANHMLKALAGGDCCVTVTLLDAFVLAKSAFHHSMNYRSVVVFGRGRVVDNHAQKRAVLDALVDRFAPQRSQHTRGPDDGELRATLVIEVPIGEASAKIRTGPPIDSEEDLALPHWAGLIPIVTTKGDPIPVP